MTRALVLAAALVAFGNVSAALIGGTSRLPGGSWAFILAGALLVVGSLLVARGGGLGREQVGLRGPLRSGALGAAAGAIIALAAVLSLPLVAAVTGRPLAYEPLRGLGGGALGSHIAFFLPLGVVLPEEVAFRGALVGLLARSGRRVALGVGGAAFALWHMAVILATVRETTLDPLSPWPAVAVLAALLIVFAGGAVLAELRIRTGTIATTVGAHWAFNAVVLAGFWVGTL